MRSNHKRFATLADGRFKSANRGFVQNKKTKIISLIIFIISLANVLVHSNKYYFLSESLLDLLNQIPPISYIGDRAFHLAEQQSHYAFIEFMLVIAIFSVFSVFSIIYILAVKLLECFHYREKLYSPLFPVVTVALIPITYATFFLDNGTNDAGQMLFEDANFWTVALIFQITWWIITIYLLYIIFGDAPGDETSQNSQEL